VAGDVPSGVPVPGIAYQWVPSETFNAVIGVPFSSVEWKPIEPITLEAQYFPTRQVRARATWRIGSTRTSGSTTMRSGSPRARAST